MERLRSSWGGKLSLTKKVALDEEMFSIHLPSGQMPVMLGKLFNLSKLGFPYLLHGLNNRANLLTFFSSK